MARYDYDDEEPYVIIERHNGSVGSMLLGVAIGAGIALLFAPQSGEETRRDIERQARRARARASRLADDVSSSVTDTLEQARTQVEERIDAARGAVEMRTRQVDARGGGRPGRRAAGAAGARAPDCRGQGRLRSGHRGRPRAGLGDQRHRRRRRDPGGRRAGGRRSRHLARQRRYGSGSALTGRPRQPHTVVSCNRAWPAAPSSCGSAGRCATTPAGCGTTAGKTTSSSWPAGSPSTSCSPPFPSSCCSSPASATC